MSEENATKSPEREPVGQHQPCSAPHVLYTQGIPDVEPDEKTSAVWFAVARPDYPEMVSYIREEHCPLCGHEWRRHDPVDGKCDCNAHGCDNGGIGVCSCGRDLAWMQDKIQVLSRRFLQQNAKVPTTARVDP